jgi:hypothetical protein
MMTIKKFSKIFFIRLIKMPCYREILHGIQSCINYMSHLFLMIYVMLITRLGAVQTSHYRWSRSQNHTIDGQLHTRLI